ncbi:pilus assembly protein PilM [Herbaspirillum sp.]|uniref:type IV pilus biogenesis protein PilM n=1 Tax=Herbaspirillum sp. TaxID=1890675 RepID=UPI0031DED471
MAFSLALKQGRIGAHGVCAGLDIGADRIRLAVLRRQRGGLRLALLAEHVFDRPICDDGRIGDFELLATGCRQLLRRPASPVGPIALAIPATTVALIRLTLPAASSELQRWAQVRAEVAACLRQPPDEWAIDYRVLGPAPASPADVQVLAAAAPAMLVEDRLALAESLGMAACAVLVDGWRLAAFLRGPDPDAAVLHLDAAAAWLSLHAQHWHPLAWRPDGSPSAGLLVELAPLLRPAPRLLLSGDARGLDALAAALRKYAGIPATVAALPPQILVEDHAATAAGPRHLPAFHCAIALAAEGLT